MGRFAKVAVWLVVIVVVLGALTWGGVVVYRHRVYGTVYSESQTSVTVGKGDRFSLAVPDRGASVGDFWTAQVAPDGLLGDQGKRTRHKALLDRVRDPLLGGGQGTTFFTYDATATGTAKVTLSNCFQGCSSPASQAASRSVTWTITVT
ncbi:hypothetical protein ODJ79_28775 [Actinoplanes sp. KI2]|uniref:hypothetical protein n=1 Tax=Actinoplanes sp. KI2 TaxID=2983315 RepID=UPI0021D5E4CD|nr:hypothetical protein [Actinoplanes sp. KI2]MCU7727731.1 hypothetical protein [Actinoplanes sp. KI2]